ncbi:MAG TPA: N-acetylmuramoyl-L-alanine amidase [Gammaproteobacteria bacterium]|nr:N-acetylmuramoyl-L-alanine amidase AmiC precursor [bacterium BMS3Abin11]HDH16436.1 N-acetylmuramoyl-L-alanine amidase [Gammaproteobacteria bacterium]HDZ79125.1 N-acetylmuramoyl-L-alanine amidase [Gammaproteobacteria bacterium]
MMSLWGNSEHQYFMKQFILFLISISLLLPLFATSSASVSVKNLRVWNAPDNTRVVLDLSSSIDYRITPFYNPDRIAIDIKNARLSKGIPHEIKNNPYIKRFRYGNYSKNITRIVLDLKKPVRVKSFTLKPNNVYGYRLVVDLFDKKKTVAAKIIRPPAKRTGIVTIAIDAGHGGEDFGASGKKKTREKKIVLSIAKELKKLVDKDPALRSHMTRTGDYYVSLRRRTKQARRANADLFISIHADAFRRSSARGAAVFTLSNSGASSETARWLANKENAADLVGGASISDREDVVAGVLLDMQMDKTLEYSLSFGGQVLKEMRKITKLHSKTVQQAGFVVLKSPDIPSVLIETGFISNPYEERKLKSRKYQKQVATAIYKGIKQFISHEKVAFMKPASTRK